jgi:putative ABC transport system permease protein
MLSTVWRVAVAGIRARRLQSLLVAATVALSVGVLGGSIVYGDSAQAAFYDDLARAATGVDVVARPDDPPAPPGPAELSAIARLPGVEHVDGRVVTRMGLLGRDGRVLSNEGETGYAVSVPSWSGFSMFHVLSGQTPGPGEAALDEPTAAREGIGVGDRVTLLDDQGAPHPATVVGLVDFGVTSVLEDHSVLVLPTVDLDRYVPRHGYNEIVVAGQVGPAEVGSVLGPRYRIDSGAGYRAEIARDSAKYVGGFLRTLRAASLVALVVAILVAYNTFQILVTQRSREHALLRCVGAAKRDVMRLVLAESFLLGLAAAGGSVLVAILGGYGFSVGQRLFGHAPTAELVVTPLAVAAPLVAGVAVTMLSAVLPALTAARIPPLAALRAGPDDGRPAGARRWQLAVAAGLAVAGVVGIGLGHGKGFDGLTSIVVGALLALVALVLVLPFAVTRLGPPARWLLRRSRIGTLAVGSAERHPVRFAAGTAALLVGIAPLTAFAILVSTAQVQRDRELTENFPADFVVSHAGREDPTGFPPSLVDGLRARPEFAVVATGQVALAEADGCCSRIGTAEDGVLGSRLAVEVREGRLDGLRPGTAAVNTRFADTHHIGPGDRLTLPGWTADVVATFDGTPLPADVLVNAADYARSELDGKQYLLIRRAPGVAAGNATTVLEQSLAGDPLAVVASVAQRQESLADSLDRRLAQFTVLLGLAMLIAVAGVANTLSLSVLERTRELGLLRALGLTGGQVHRMLLIEAGLSITVGIVVGLAFGLGFGWLTAAELIAQYGHGTPAVPALTIGAYALAAAGAGALISLLPARRAARVSVISAIDST